MDSTDPLMIVGLGNPGPKYRNNRHNIGFQVVDAIAELDSSFQWRSSSRFAAEIAKGVLEGRDILLVKPQTFMNLSGQSVSKLAGFYAIPVDHIIAIHDDVDLEPGRLRIKSGGGDGGHKGIRSMAQCLGNPHFIRIRIGIGRPLRGEVADFVLQNFSADELDLMKDAVQRAKDAISLLLEAGLTAAMNKYNGPLPNNNDHGPNSPQNK
jgi:PTH1 family peptidyl-tRNA hydrolase